MLSYNIVYENGKDHEGLSPFCIQKVLDQTAEFVKNDFRL
jgi:hypothetical protein